MCHWGRLPPRNIANIFCSNGYTFNSRWRHCPEFQQEKHLGGFLNWNLLFKKVNVYGNNSTSIQAFGHTRAGRLASPQKCCFYSFVHCVAVVSRVPCRFISSIVNVGETLYKRSRNTKSWNHPVVGRGTTSRPFHFGRFLCNRISFWVTFNGQTATRIHWLCCNGATWSSQGVRDDALWLEEGRGVGDALTVWRPGLGDKGRAFWIHTPTDRFYFLISFFGTRLHCWRFVISCSI